MTGLKNKRGLRFWESECCREHFNRTRGMRIFHFFLNESPYKSFFFAVYTWEDAHVVKFWRIKKKLRFFCRQESRLLFLWVEPLFWNFSFCVYADFFGNSSSPSAVRSFFFSLVGTKLREIIFKKKSAALFVPRGPAQNRFRLHSNWLAKNHVQLLDFAHTQYIKKKQNEFSFLFSKKRD